MSEIPLEFTNEVFYNIIKNKRVNLLNYFIDILWEIQGRTDHNEVFKYLKHSLQDYSTFCSCLGIISEVDSPLSLLDVFSWHLITYSRKKSTFLKQISIKKVGDYKNEPIISYVDIKSKLFELDDRIEDGKTHIVKYEGQFFQHWEKLYNPYTTIPDKLIRDNFENTFTKIPNTYDELIQWYSSNKNFRLGKIFEEIKIFNLVKMDKESKYLQMLIMNMNNIEDTKYITEQIFQLFDYSKIILIFEISDNFNKEVILRVLAKTLKYCEEEEWFDHYYQQFRLGYSLLKIIEAYYTPTLGVEFSSENVSLSAQSIVSKIGHINNKIITESPIYIQLRQELENDMVEEFINDVLDSKTRHGIQVLKLSSKIDIEAIIKDNMVSREIDFQYLLDKLLSGDRSLFTYYVNEVNKSLKVEGLRQNKKKDRFKFRVHLDSSIIDFLFDISEKHTENLDGGFSPIPLMDNLELVMSKATSDWWRYNVKARLKILKKNIKVFFYYTDRNSVEEDTIKLIENTRDSKENIQPVDTQSKLPPVFVHILVGYKYENQIYDSSHQRCSSLSVYRVVKSGKMVFQDFCLSSFVEKLDRVLKRKLEFYGIKNVKVKESKQEGYILLTQGDSSKEVEVEFNDEDLESICEQLVKEIDTMA